MTKTAGTAEWADTNVNFISGCSHDCKYCYAKRMALRFKRIETPDDWKTMTLRPHDIAKNYAKRKGRIMFPSSHDLCPEFLQETFDVLTKLVVAGNEVLITTKPHLDVIDHITNFFTKYKDQIQFRFTIGTDNTECLKWWESGAPSYNERLTSLKVAYARGYKTSVSMEPLLTTKPATLITAIEPYVTESIWIGIMNGIPKDTPPKYADHIKMTRSRLFLENLVRDFGAHTLIRWKDSVPRRLKVPEIFL